MTKKELSKFVEPSNLTGEWFDRAETYFWHDRNPFEVKFGVEKMTGTLLKRDLGDTADLSYVGSSNAGADERALRLRFEAVIDSRKLYSLQVESKAPRKWVAEEAFLKSAKRALEYWRSQLEIASAEIAWASASQALFLQEKWESIAMEAEAASRVEDPAPIAALQKTVLDALRAGKSFRTAHKEGVTSLFFDGQSFMRSDYGDEAKTETYPSDEAMILAVRRFYDWDSCRDMFPHRPPELDVWKYILGQLRG